MYVPYIKQEEPLKNECQHFLDCIRHGKKPLTDGQQGLELVRILEASSQSLKLGGAPVEFSHSQNSDQWNLSIPRISSGNGISIPRISSDQLKQDGSLANERIARKQKVYSGNGNGHRSEER